MSLMENGSLSAADVAAVTRLEGQAEAWLSFFI